MSTNPNPSPIAADARTRPDFPKRAVITAGMPYGNKELHFGHIGGVFVQADAFARFLRDRIGSENVIFVSGTDCYGSPIVEDFRKLREAAKEGTPSGNRRPSDVRNEALPTTIEAFVEHNHERQKQVLAAYSISPDLFGASSFGPAAQMHRELGATILETLHAHGYLSQHSTYQFYDSAHDAYLNGRQVSGRCPIEGCRSEKAYADECALGHQYEPNELIDPRSTLSGERPEMRQVVNWYLDLPRFRPRLEEWIASVEQLPSCRPFVVTTIREFFEPPTVHVTNVQMDAVDALSDGLPPHERAEGKSKSTRLVFTSLGDRDAACSLFTTHGIHYRKGKTLVPFRLTGNVDWGLPAPELESVSGLTFWVWPESLWAPISFTRTLLSQSGHGPDEWKRFWASRDAQVYQFIGEDNVYFYGPAEMAIFMGLQPGTPSINPPDGMIRLPELVVNNHILFLDKKASSSSEVKPPMAGKLLDYYTSDQLRTHFLSLGLNKRSVGFKPKPLDPNAGERDGDPVLKEGNLLSNVLNKAVRTCFYSLQQYYGGAMPIGSVSPDLIRDSEAALLDYEEAIFRHEFSRAVTITDNYIRQINKRWDAGMRSLKEQEDDQLRRRTLIDSFHMVRVACLLLHPIAPTGTEKVREYLGFDREFFSWGRAFDTIYDFMKDPASHRFRELQPREDFFEKHPSQIR